MFQFVKFVNKNFNKCIEKYLFNLMVRTAITLTILKRRYLKTNQQRSWKKTPGSDLGKPLLG